MHALWKWMLNHRLHALGMLMILSSPIVGYGLYAAFSYLADALRLGFLAMLFMGALGFVAGGAYATYGVALILRGHRRLCGEHGCPAHLT